VESSNPCCWKGEQLNHHGCDVWCVCGVCCGLVWLSSIIVFVCRKVPQNYHKIRLRAYFVSHIGLAPNQGRLNKRPRTPKTEPSRVVIPVQGCYHMPMDNINVLKHFICLIWILEKVWIGCQPQPWHHNDNISTPHKWPTTPETEPSRVGICVRLLP
jgi:hypothetical protein